MIRIKSKEWLRRILITRFEHNILSIYKDRGKVWLSELQQRVSSLAELWNLSELSPYSHLSYNYILSGYQRNRPIVLKLSLDEAGLALEREALEAFCEYGGISILDFQQDALLLERAEPGISLKGQPKAIQIACDVISNLNRAPIPTNHYLFLNLARAVEVYLT